MLNQCQFIGNLGRDPEIRSTQGGNRCANLRLAVSEKWKDRTTGERKEHTEWIPITIWNEGLVRICEQYLKKGSKIFVSGAFKTRKWQDQSGQDRYSTEVVLQGFGGSLQMLDGRSEGGQSGGGYDQSGNSGGGYDSGSGGGYGAGGVPDDDSIPFAPECRI